MISKYIGGTGATSLSESLKSNISHTKLDMRSDDKRKKTHKRHPSTIHTSLSITSTGNNIGDAGVSSFREMLVTYTTLTELYINCGKH